MAPPRRRTDDEEEDYSRVRGGMPSPFNGHTKWVVSTFAALLVTSVIALAMRDRNGIDKEQSRQDAEIATLQVAVSDIVATQAGTAADLRAIKETVDRIEARLTPRRRE